MSDPGSDRAASPSREQRPSYCAIDRMSRWKRTVHRTGHGARAIPGAAAARPTREWQTCRSVARAGMCHAPCVARSAAAAAADRSSTSAACAPSRQSPPAQQAPSPQATLTARTHPQPGDRARGHKVRVNAVLPSLPRRRTSACPEGPGGRGARGLHHIPPTTRGGDDAGSRDSRGRRSSRDDRRERTAAVGP
jgi:hypothetical protein